MQKFQKFLDEGEYYAFGSNCVVTSPLGDVDYIYSPGMTLVDYFAGQAIAGMMAAPEVSGEPDDVAETAYRLADAMMRVREKRKQVPGQS